MEGLEKTLAISAVNTHLINLCTLITFNTISYVYHDLFASDGTLGKYSVVNCLSKGFKGSSGGKHFNGLKLSSSQKQLPFGHFMHLFPSR